MEWKIVRSTEDQKNLRKKWRMFQRRYVERKICILIFYFYNNVTKWK